MALSNAAIHIISVVAVLFPLMLSSDGKPAVQGPHLESYSEVKVKGCFNYNQTLGICFDVGKDVMKLATQTAHKPISP